MQQCCLACAEVEVPPPTKRTHSGLFFGATTGDGGKHSQSAHGEANWSGNRSPRAQGSRQPAEPSERARQQAGRRGSERRRASVKLRVSGSKEQRSQGWSIFSTGEAMADLGPDAFKISAEEQVSLSHRRVINESTGT